MHSYERTLLARLGFMDPDRHCPLHEAACLYLANADVAKKLVEKVVDLGPNQKTYRDGVHGEEEVSFSEKSSILDLRTKSEYEIHKGFNEFRVTIGFVDLVCSYKLKSNRSAIKRRQFASSAPFNPWKLQCDQAHCSLEQIGIEIKATEQHVSTAVRQINLFRGYSTIRTWVLATTFPLTQIQTDFLRSAQIHHFYLAKQFHDFARRTSRSPLSKSMEV